MESQRVILVDGASGRVAAGGHAAIECRGIDQATGNEVFRVGPLYGGTNNAAEFLAIVLGLKLDESALIMSDCLTAIAWVRRCRTKDVARYVGACRNRVENATAWLQSHPRAHKRVAWWETIRLGEIPADFGRK